jgi:hypothetical protein
MGGRGHWLGQGRWAARGAAGGAGAGGGDLQELLVAKVGAGDGGPGAVVPRALGRLGRRWRGRPWQGATCGSCWWPR